MRHKLDNRSRLQQIESLYAQSKAEFPNVLDLTARELLALQTAHAKIILVDVRTPAEQAVSMLPAALTAPQFEAALDQHTHARIVVYCKTGHRSGHYAQHLLTQGFTNVRNLKGAILAWTHVGGPLQNDAGPTQKVNVLNPAGDLTAHGYEGIW